MASIRRCRAARTCSVLVAVTALAGCQKLEPDNTVVAAATADEVSDSGASDASVDASPEHTNLESSGDAWNAAAVDSPGVQAESCTCPSASMCCSGHCVANDTDNCFACGARCVGQTPVCSAAARGCVCAAGSCDGGVCSPQTGVCGGAALPDADVYVDAAAPIGGDGSPARPFKTITAALFALAGTRDAGAPKTRIYAAAGTYDEALGETFPLDLRGLSLQGAGRDSTTIVGTGAQRVLWEPGGASDDVSVAVLAGSDTLPTRLSNLTLRPAVGTVPLGHHGIVCSRGNPLSDASDSGVTVLDSVRVGPGFHHAVSALASGAPTLSGCHLRMTRSEVRDSSVGVLARGCGSTALPSKVVIEIGSIAPDSGNDLFGMQTATNSGPAVLVEACVASASFRNNRMSDNGTAVALDARGNGTTAIHLVFVSNVVERSSVAGISLAGGPATVDTFDDNTITHTSKSLVGDLATAASGLYVESYAGLSARFARARRNTITANDVGLFIVSPEGASVSASNPPSDFGTAGDPGQNVFRCNSGATYGYDVLLWFPTSVALPFVGNTWDHSPPTIIDGTAKNGADVQLVGLFASSIDASQSATLADPCPTGQIAGP